jgi:hypothetical protein
MLLGAIGPWVRVGRFALSGFEGVGLPVALLAGLAVGVSALQLSTQRRSLFVVLGIFGLFALGGSVVAWTLLKLFSGSAHLLSFVLARGAHRAAFESHAPSAAWGLWLLPLSAASLALSSFAGAATRAVPRPRSPIVDVHPSVPPAPVPGDFGPDQLPPRWR